ncbi:zn 2cys6 transcription factor [Penicillium capsulatum]|uniref:Zn 2cys6 transcription factor n=1 Tax=Penicillium capsulatum TaxID=69766 RepID=A0A9W9LXA6_9EURO|nr:zn 2cys6 transcription factor [Penicillium capsulatum]KAJ6121612.1 zn 2cys6 transcription factor [Penicillium capsulatum]
MCEIKQGLFLPTARGASSATAKVVRVVLVPPGQLEVKNQPHPSESSRVGPNLSQEPSPVSSSEYARSPDMPQSLGSYVSNGLPPLQIWPLSANESELSQLFHRYRNRISCYFPFVVIPDVPPAQLHAEKPFLFKAIMMASSYTDRTNQLQLGTQLTEELGRRLLVNGETSMDILQGLLIHIAWYHVYRRHSSQMTNLLQLAIALLADMGLNKPTHGNDRRKYMFDSSRITHGVLAESRMMTNDERRALLGCFYVSSIVCSIFRRVDALEYTPFMDKQLNDLLDTRERESDLLLARMVQIQQFAERVVDTVSYEETDGSQIHHAPVVLHLRALRNEFRTQAQSYPSHIEDREILQLQKYVVEIMIHENGLYNAFWEAPSSTNERIDVLWTLLQSIKSFFEIFWNLSDLAIHEIPYSSWGLSTYVILIFSRLSMLECPGWDHEVAKDNIEFVAVLDALIAKTMSASDYGAARWLSGAQDEVCRRILEKLRFIKSWWQASRPGANLAELKPISPYLDPAASGTFLGDDFWEDLMRDCEPLQF